MIFEHRLVWFSEETPGEGSEGESEAREKASEGESIDEAERAEGFEVVEQAEAADRANSDPDAEAEEALDKLPGGEQAVTEEEAPPAEPEEEKSFMEQAKEALSYFFGGFWKDLFSDPKYALATLLGFFGGSAVVDIAKNSAKKEAVRKDIAEKFEGVMGEYGLPSGIAVTEEDVGNLKQYKIQSLNKPKKIEKEKDLRKFLDAKRDQGLLETIPPDVTCLTDLVLALDVVPAPEEPVAGESTDEGESVDVITGEPIEDQPAEVEKPKTGFAIAPTGRVNMKSGEFCPFQLHDGRSIKIYGDSFVVGKGSEAKRFKVKAKGIEVVFNSVRPLSGGRFELDIKPASKIIGMGVNPEPAPISTSQVVSMIEFLYQNKNNASFSQEHTIDGEAVNFEFTAA